MPWANGLRHSAIIWAVAAYTSMGLACDLSTVYTGASAAPLMAAAQRQRPNHFLWIDDSWLLVSHGIFLRMLQVRPTLRGETTRMQCCEMCSAETTCLCSASC